MPPVPSTHARAMAARDLTVAASYAALAASRATIAYSGRRLGEAERQIASSLARCEALRAFIRDHPRA